MISRRPRGSRPWAIRPCHARDRRHHVLVLGPLAPRRQCPRARRHRRLRRHLQGGRGPAGPPSLRRSPPSPASRRTAAARARWHQPPRSLHRGSCPSASSGLAPGSCAHLGWS
eukprot:8439817-Pyramimonas_sp.AAC.1